MVCSGCALLCNDIETEITGEDLTTCRHICRRGYDLVSAALAARQAPGCFVEGRVTTLEEAVLTAARLLRKAKQPLFWGLDNTAMEDQAAGLKLAFRLGAIIDGVSSGAVGSTVKAVIKGTIPTCTLEEVRAHADTVIYWGSNPHQTHPRHLSRFTYYPRGDTVQRNWELERQLVCIDVHTTEMEAISKFFIKLTPGEEQSFQVSLGQALAGKPAPDPRAKELLNIIQNSRYPVVFAGDGLFCEPEGRPDPFCQILQILERVRVIPMLTSFNQRGLYHNLFAETGKADKARPDSKAVFTSSLSFQGQSGAGTVDCCLFIGPGPMSSLPRQLAGVLHQIPVIVFNPLISAYNAAARVMVKVGLTGLSAGGQAVRQDGLEVKINPVFSEPAPTAGHIFAMILAAL